MYQSELLKGIPRDLFCSKLYWNCRVGELLAFYLRMKIYYSNFAGFVSQNCSMASFEWNAVQIFAIFM